MANSEKLQPVGQLWLSRDGENVLGDSRVALLEQIAATGSITQAGKAVGISYRTAWLAVDQLNHLAGEPLVESSAGGKSGGGARLTTYGETWVKVYRALQREHEQYLDRLREGIRDFDRFLQLTRKLSLKTSARNQLFGTVETILKTELKAAVFLRLKGGDKIHSEITLEGLESLGLRVGEEAYALIKANWISITPYVPTQKSRRNPSEKDNALRGKVMALKSGKERVEAVLRLVGGHTLIAALPAKTVKAMALAEGEEVFGNFAASDVILGVAR